ncbi:CDP-glycerol glycerophosphotransferase family protein [Photobacterium sanguinicancri]|uniref:CDP-glycerol glycerophosphotransferase family protein n=1 Tax=Photobacterium sanguinicancri TaxID=875932 RepID=UPI0021C3F194|nr:CDP-glycerol glycerophosphotransferase family protein [Photobacterium sanguinicancri]
MVGLKSFFRTFLPASLYGLIRVVVMRFKIVIARLCHYHLLTKIRGKTTVNITFLVYDSSVWKCEGLYQRFILDERYNVSILVCPITNCSATDREKRVNICFDFFKSKGANVKIAEHSDVLLDEADIVFFTNPHDITEQKYYSKLFFRKLCCYVPYSHQISSYDNNYAQYDRPFHNLMWKIFAPQIEEIEIFESDSINKGSNVVVSGYPGVECFFDKSRIFKSVWKDQEDNKKKIIWAPHHTVSDPNLKFSNFYSQASLIFELAEKYKKQTQWCFKPHPLLYSNLLSDGVWSRKKINEFYESWRTSPNKQLELGSYENIFMASDAMIHDSGSFLAEYLYVDKPVMHLAESNNVTEYLNKFGLACYSVCCKNVPGNMAIEPFLLNVIEGVDSKKEEREVFLSQIKNTYFKNGFTPSDYIFDYINKYIINK